VPPPVLAAPAGGYTARVHETVAPGEAGAAPQPPPLALAVGLELVTRYRLRLTDARDARLGELASAYQLGAAAWTGRRAAFVGFYRPPDDPDAAALDLEERCRIARRWGEARLPAQSAERCDILLVAVGRVPRPVRRDEAPGAVHVGAAAIDADGTVTVLQPLPRGLPGAAELRHHARTLRQGTVAPTLAAVDLAERQTVAAGYVTPARRALVSRPLCTYTLIGVMVAVYVLEKVVDGSVHGGARVTSVDLGTVCSGPVTPDCTASLDNWWRLVTSDFLHDPSNILHIGGNALALYFLGGLVEQLYGRLVLLGTFLATAALGDLFWIGCTALGLTNPAPGLGASGGILGLMGLLVMLGRVQGRDVPVGIASAIRQYAIAYSLFVIFFSVFAVVQNVNNFVHLGGFIAGVLLGLVVPPVEAIGGRRLHLVEQGLILAIIAAALVALGIGAHHLADILTQPPGDLSPGP
jgi:membrane associated rhomboid family serine protease